MLTLLCSLFEIDSSNAQRVKILGNKKHLPSTILDAQPEDRSFWEHKLIGEVLVMR